MVWQAGMGLLLIGIAGQRLGRQAWRSSLTADESALVAKLDALCAAGVTDMAQYAAASDEWR